MGGLPLCVFVCGHFQVMTWRLLLLVGQGQAAGLSNSRGPDKTSSYHSGQQQHAPWPVVVFANQQQSLAGEKTYYSISTVLICAVDFDEFITKKK
jgi:hypothetical protein